MDRPSEPQLDAVLSAAEELRALEERTNREIGEAKRRLASKVDALGEIENRSALLRAAIYAYWYAPETSADQLALLAVGKRSAPVMLKRSEAISIGFPCNDCGMDLAITSRSMMREALTVAAGGARGLTGRQLICSDCRTKRSKEWERERDLYKSEQEERRQFLSRLSYTEYLTTPEWSASRNAVMSVMLYLRDRLSCEVCPELEGLSFVHTQLDLAAGHEVVNLLCTACSGALQRAGKLAYPPLPANRAPRIELDLAERAFRKERYGDGYEEE